MNNTFYTPKEVAQILKVKPETVIRLIRSSMLSATIVGKQYRISEEQLQEYYEANTIQRSEEM